MRKNFLVGNDKHLSQEATYLDYFSKKHPFHIVDNNFLLPEDDIIRLPFLRNYDRYSITPEYLIIENKKNTLNQPWRIFRATPRTGDANKRHDSHGKSRHVDKG